MERLLRKARPCGYSPWAHSLPSYQAWLGPTKCVNLVGLDPRGHLLRKTLLRRRWNAGSSPAMTEERLWQASCVRSIGNRFSVPIPKFAHSCGTSDANFGIKKTTSNFMISSAVFILPARSDVEATAKRRRVAAPNASRAKLVLEFGAHSGGVGSLSCARYTIVSMRWKRMQRDLSGNLLKTASLKGSINSAPSACHRYLQHSMNFISPASPPALSSGALLT